jgi:hypothetical protein
VAAPPASSGDGPAEMIVAASPKGSPSELGTPPIGGGDAVRGVTGAVRGLTGVAKGAVSRRGARLSRRLVKHEGH